jgi:hypothetical protein
MAKTSKVGPKTKCADVKKGGFTQGESKQRAMFHETKEGDKRVYLPKNKGGRIV